jgi:acetaldehyde dehydrogenase (acetylating)
MATKLKAAILGSGHIGTDLIIKILRHGQYLEVGALVGIDPASEGLDRARRLGVAATHESAEGLAKLPVRRNLRGQEDMIVDVALDLVGRRSGAERGEMRGPQRLRRATAR